MDNLICHLWERMARCWCLHFHCYLINRSRGKYECGVCGREYPDPARL